MSKEQRVAVAAKLASNIRGNDATTCCLHVVVDDMNIGDTWVALSIIRAARRQHRDCLKLTLSVR